MSRGHASAFGLSFGLSLLSACGGAPSKTSVPSSKTVADTPKTGTLLREFPGDADTKSGSRDSLFPKTKPDKVNWSALDSSQRQQLAELADRYLRFVGSARTQRQSASALLEMAKKAGARPLEDASKVKPGQLYYWKDTASSSIAFLRVGTEPIESGLRVMTASIDSGEIRLTPKPVYEKSGLTLLDTSILGRMEVETWLNTPLALHVYVAPKGSQAKGSQAKGSQAKAIEFVIGDDPDEPVFVIPDLLPHLSRKVQRNKLVDSPERMDAIAGFSAKAVFGMLRRYGMSAADFERAEATLVPAADPTFIGVDRGLVAAANHYARAVPFVAMEALIEGTPKHSSVVIFMGHNRRSYAGADAVSHVENLLPRIIKAHDSSKDLLDIQRIYSKSRVLLFGDKSGSRNKGIVLNSRRDDATPRAFRHALQLFADGGVPVQVSEKSGWSQAREVSSLDIATVEFGLPIAGLGTPYELLSTLDLYYAKQACRAWVNQ
ncbi:MAG: hypothetical protein JKY56_14190 [Kofleriaceae bacterium]|nr:hypothetical protein [Kofleriaceae bacterium]